MQVGWMDKYWKTGTVRHLCVHPGCWHHSRAAYVCVSGCGSSCMLRTCGDDVERWDRAAAVPYLATSVRPHPRCLWANQSTAARTSSSLIYVPVGASAAFTVRGLHRLCSMDAPSDDQQESFEWKMRRELVFHRNVQVWLHTTELSLLLNAICDATGVILTLIPGKRSMCPSLLSGPWYFSIA